MPLLEIKDLSISFGGIMALSGVDLAVQENSILGIIGPNGSGKTTLFNCLTGITIPTGETSSSRGRVFAGFPRTASPPGEWPALFKTCVYS